MATNRQNNTNQPQFLTFMILRILSVLFCVFCVYKSVAQSPFVQASQLPIQLNPSLAGSKNKKRVCVGINTIRTNDIEHHNYALSYDQNIKKINSGIGVYYLNQHFSYRTLGSWPPYNQQYTGTGNKSAGICLAPKYSIKNKKDVNNAIVTFSPSAFIEYGTNTHSYLIAAREEFPYTPKNNDSASIEFDLYNYKNRYLKYGLGFEANTSKLIFLAKVSFVRNAYSENITTTKVLIADKTAYSISENQLGQSLSIFYSFESAIHIGYSFSTNPKSKFSFTPLVGIGKTYYFNIDPERLSYFNDTYRYGISNTDLSGISYLHGTANFNYKNYIAGMAYTKFHNTIYKGATIGFQNDFLKITCSIGLNIVSSFTKFHTIEITTGFYF